MDLFIGDSDTKMDIKSVLYALWTLYTKAEKSY